MSVRKILFGLILSFILVIGSVHAQQLKFIQLTDVHISAETSSTTNGRMLKDAKLLLKDAVEQINRMDDIDFVVFTGDMIDLPQEKLLEDFGSITKGLKPEWYWTTGNHDIGMDLNKKDFVKQINKINHNKRHKPYYSVENGDFVLIFMDGTIEKFPTAHAKFPKEELDWLDRELTKYKDKYALIFEHFPVVEPFESSDHYIINADEYLEVLDRHKNVAAFITGHYHAAKIKKRNDVLHISSPALVQYPNAFRIITMESKDNGNLEISFDFKQTGLDEIREKSRYSTKSYLLNLGRKFDRDVIMVLHKPLG